VSSSEGNSARAEKLVRMRQDQVARARSALGEAAANLERVREQIEEVMEAMAQHNAAAHEALLHKAPHSALGVYRRCVDDLQAVAATQQACMAEAQKKVRRRRAELTRLLAELKAARLVKRQRDTLKTRRARRRETQEQDDLHAARESRPRRSEG